MFPKLLKKWSILHPDGFGKLLKIEVWSLCFCSACILSIFTVMVLSLYWKYVGWGDGAKIYRLEENRQADLFVQQVLRMLCFFPNGRLNHQCGRHYHHYHHHFLFLLLHHHHHHYCHQKYHHHHFHHVYHRHHHRHHHHPISILLPPCFHSGRRWWLTCGGHLSTSTWGNGKYKIGSKIYTSPPGFSCFFLGDSYKPSLAAGILGGGVPQGMWLCGVSCDYTWSVWLLIVSDWWFTGHQIIQWWKGGV